MSVLFPPYKKKIPNSSELVIYSSIDVFSRWSRLSMRAIGCPRPWTAPWRCTSSCWTAGRERGPTGPSSDRLSTCWTSWSATPTHWRGPGETPVSGERAGRTDVTEMGEQTDSLYKNCSKHTSFSKIPVIITIFRILIYFLQELVKLCAKTFDKSIFKPDLDVLAPSLNAVLFRNVVEFYIKLATTGNMLQIYSFFLCQEAIFPHSCTLE